MRRCGSRFRICRCFPAELRIGTWHRGSDTDRTTTCSRTHTTWPTTVHWMMQSYVVGEENTRTPTPTSCLRVLQTLRFIQIAQNHMFQNGDYRHHSRSMPQITDIRVHHVRTILLRFSDMETATSAFREMAKMRSTRIVVPR